MSAAANWLEAGAFGAPYPYVALATVAWFTLIYAVIAGGAYLVVVDRLPELTVPESTLRAGYRLVLHGLASEMLYELLVRAKRHEPTLASAAPC